MKINKLIILNIILGLFIYGCSGIAQKEIDILPSSTLSSNQSGVNTSFSVPPTIIPPSTNSITPSTGSSPGCQNRNILTGNIYSNTQNKVNYEFQSSVNSKDYFDEINSEKPLGDVEISYNGKTIKTDSKGIFNIPMTDNKEDTKFKFSKQGYVSDERVINNTCLFHLGLSPLYTDELSAKEIKFNSKYYSSEYSSIPDFFTTVKNKEATYNEFSYFIIDSEEKAKKVNFNDKVDFKNDIVFMITNGDPFGFPPAIIDTAMESDKKFILSSHKTRYLNISQLEVKVFPQGDDFKVKLQSIILPKSKGIDVYINKDKKYSIN